jgi:hypothetical protein
MGANMVNYDISPLRVISQEVLPDVYVLSVAVANRIIRHADFTLIVTLEGGPCSICSYSPRGFASSRVIVRINIL